MSKYICKYSTLLDTNDFASEVQINKGEMYYIEYVNKHVYYLHNLYDGEELFLGEIWGTVSDYFVTLAEWRDMQLNSILND